MRVSVRLSQLVSDRRNPRRVKPERDAHRRLVASIRAHGLLEPLVVRPHDPEGDTYKVIAGRRRLEALRDVYRGSDNDPKIECELREVDDDTAGALALAENFAREGMHPLDEAEAFARLAHVECKGVAAIAAEFGVAHGYVRQRMKLATLHEVVKAAYRQGHVDTATAKAFAAVPPDRQLEVWEEMGGQPRHAAHVRHVIENGWIDAKHALFDVSTLPDEAVSRDLFCERVLIERKAFMAAQAEALLAHRHALVDDGWGEVIVAHRADVQDRLYNMDTPEAEYDEATTAKLAEIEDRRDKLSAEFDALNEGDEEREAELQAQFEALDDEEQNAIDAATPTYSEATKSVAKAFLILDPDGRVHTEYRVPRRSHSRKSAHVSGNGTVSVGGDSRPVSGGDAEVPTPDDLSDRQLAPLLTHQAIAVRAGLLDHDRLRKIVLAIALHDKVRPEALCIARQPNGTDLHADHSDTFDSPTLATLREGRAEVDPLRDRVSVDEAEAFDALTGLPTTQVDRLIDSLVIAAIAAHLQRPTPLVVKLAEALEIRLRDHWRPDAAWLGSYKKIQLAHLLGELCGPAHGSAAERRKKSELVDELATLFTDAAEGRLEDAALAERVNAWLPAVMRDAADDADTPSEAVAA